MLLEGPEVVTVVQGDAYEDRLVRIMDTNEMLAEPRYISISYDSPSLNADTLDDVGTYFISYTVKAPWTSTPTVTIRRTIVVKDLNECSLRPTDAKWNKWRPRCHKWAKCSNINGDIRARAALAPLEMVQKATARVSRRKGTLPRGMRRTALAAWM